LHIPPSVAVVILNWNGKRFLQQFLPSVLASTYKNFKVVVADNASADDSISFLQTHFPQVELILLQQNYGFARGYNEALKQVQADYYVLLNSDVQVTPNWLEPVIDLLERNLLYAACQPKILAWHHKELFEYAGAAGGWIDLYGYPFARGRIFEVCEEDKGQYDQPEEIFWASGAAMVIRSAVYHQAGGLDEYLFAHQEEIDLCWRIQLLGYKVICCPRSVVYHVGGGTLPRGKSRKTFLNFRNNQILLAKNLPWREKWWKIPFRILLDWVSAVKALADGDGGFFTSVIKAHAAFFYWLIFKKSRTIRTKKKRLKDLSGVYHGSIVWAHFVKKKKYFSETISKESQQFL
jgi:hypothetical protein